MEDYDPYTADNVKGVPPLSISLTVCTKSWYKSYRFSIFMILLFNSCFVFHNFLCKVFFISDVSDIYIIDRYSVPDICRSVGGVYRVPKFKLK